MWNDGRVRIAGEGMQNSVGRPKGGNKVARFLPSAAAFKCRINPTRRKKPGATRRADAMRLWSRRGEGNRAGGPLFRNAGVFIGRVHLAHTFFCHLQHFYIFGRPPFL